MAVMPGLTGHLMAGLRIQEARRKNFRFAPSLFVSLGLCPNPGHYGLLLHRPSLTASASGWSRLALPLPFTWPRAAMVFPLVPPSCYAL